jgi:hypothetical protein
VTQLRNYQPHANEDEALKQEIDESLDEALQETFPASDPITPAIPRLDKKKPGEAA